jgi:hypothetical protein
MHTRLALVGNLSALLKAWPAGRRAAFVAFAIAGTIAGAAQASAAGMSTPSVSGLTLAQVQVETFSGRSNNDRPRPRDRYVCVVPPQQSDDRQRPYVCRANEGRVGGTCRCPNVTGNGRLDLDN